MRQGALVYDQQSERMDVRFGPEKYYGGLHCGTRLDVQMGTYWKPTRIEYDWGEKSDIYRRWKEVKKLNGKSKNQYYNRKPQWFSCRRCG